MLDARVVSNASAVKIAYAAWTKGTAAMLLAIRELARREGVEEPLLAEWDLSLPELRERHARALRSAEAKGWRWVGEMEEIAATFEADGLPGGLPPRRRRGLPRAMSATARGADPPGRAALRRRRATTAPRSARSPRRSACRRARSTRTSSRSRTCSTRRWREGARAFHAGLDAIPEELPATEKIRLALRSHLRVVADQLDVATVFVQEWRYLEGERREGILAERRRYEERIRALFREGRELGELRSDLDDATAALLALSASNWAYTWLRPGARHRRARRPLLRAAARRHARLRDT